MWNTLLVDFKILDFIKLFVNRFHFKVSNDHWLMMNILISEWVGWTSVIGFIWFFVIFIWRIQIIEYLVNIVDDDGFENTNFFSYFQQFLYFWLLLVLLRSQCALFVLYKLAEVHLDMFDQACKCVIFIKRTEIGLDWGRVQSLYIIELLCFCIGMYFHLLFLN